MRYSRGFLPFEQKKGPNSWAPDVLSVPLGPSNWAPFPFYPAKQYAHPSSCARATPNTPDGTTVSTPSPRG